MQVGQRANRLNEMGYPKARAGNRDIPMTPMVAGAPERWRPICPAGKTGLVFPNGKGNIET